MHILFTRPIEDCHDLMLKFQKLGHEVSHMPLIFVEKKNYKEINFKDFKGIIFTSSKNEKIRSNSFVCYILSTKLHVCGKKVG